MTGGRNYRGVPVGVKGWGFSAFRKRYASPLWRGVCYRWLAAKLEIPGGDCHFREMTIEQCERAITFCLGAKCSDIAQWADRNPAPADTRPST